MPYIKQAYLKGMADTQRAKFFADYTPLGWNPNTRNRLFIKTDSRNSGMYIIGTQGQGKTGLLENLISHDINQNRAVIMIDPHGDSIAKVVGCLPPDKVNKTYLLDMTDKSHPFGINLFGTDTTNDPLQQTQAVDRVMHVFDVLWGDVLTQIYLPRFLRAAVITLFANYGSTLVDMYRLLIDDTYRRKLLKNVKDETVLQFWNSYEELSASERQTQLTPLKARLESMIMGRSIVRNIIGQRETSIDLRKAIENKEIILIRLPLKTLLQDARLIGTMIIAQLHTAIFSFADMPEEQRPGFSLYVDEVQNFTTPDFAEMFTEGRKYGVRVTIAHQYRDQLPQHLQHATLTARTRISFSLKHDDAKEMAHSYLSGQASVLPEHLEPKVIEYLIGHGSDNHQVQTFIDCYLRPLQHHKKAGQVEIHKPGFQYYNIVEVAMGVRPNKVKPMAPDPTLELNHLFYEVMKRRDANLDIPAQAVYGFTNCGKGFYSEFINSFIKSRLVSPYIQYPPYLVVTNREGTHWTRQPETGKEQMYHFLFHLRMTMAHLADNPLGKKSNQSAAEVATMLTQLPRRAAFVRSGEDVGVIYTDDTPRSANAETVRKRFYLIIGQTRAKYCTPVELLNGLAPQPEMKTEPPVMRWEEV